MPASLYFFIALAALLAGYFVYGTFVEKVFGADPKRATPVCRMADGVDFVEMKPWKVFLIQLLNIAGLGPVFGPILGALYGPTALLWVVFGSIFAGAVHDYFSGMLSIRYNGASIPEAVGYNLGNTIRQIMRVFSVVLLVLVGVVFVAGPAGLLANLTGVDAMVFVAIIFAYYFIATVLPVDKIIGTVYPFFAVLLVFMAVGLVSMLFIKGYDFYPAAQWVNQHPAGLPIFPMVFITIACGAVSGFHATQSPMMARCIANEKYGRPVFYGAMIAEGVIGLIWVTLGMSFFPDPAALAAVLGPKGNAALVVNNISVSLLGGFGGALAILGVVVLPVTSGDTAFRSARLTIADIFGYDQRPNRNRLSIAVPLFVIGVALNFIPFGILWRYFGWANQTLAAIVLWTGAAYLLHRGRFHWVATLPAMFMTAVSVSYICFEKSMGFGMPYQMANIVAVVITVICAAALLTKGRNRLASEPADS